jgi:hypothetical protein
MQTTPPTDPVRFTLSYNERLPGPTKARSSAFVPLPSYRTIPFSQGKQLHQMGQAGLARAGLPGTRAGAWRWSHPTGDADSGDEPTAGLGRRGGECGRSGPGDATELLPMSLEPAAGGSWRSLAVVLRRAGSET